jgi:serine/threonine protein kinase
VDATMALGSVNRDDFLVHLAASGLIDEAELAALRADATADILRMSETLLSKKLLTPFQLDAITTGQPQNLRMGNYDLISMLGKGGMGTVFKARHRRMKRLVAIKLILAQYCSESAFIARFQREVETIARLGHPNIVMAYDADETEQGHFLVMELVDGRDLASEVEKHGPLDVARAIEYTLQAARGLAYAHSQGIVHRDIKPHNLLKDDRNTIKVTDLGLASLTSSKAGNGLTQSGGMLGTVDYMPPEQAVDSASIDARADIYSLGCTLYFLLAGKPPYSGQSMMSVLLKHRDAPIPPLTEIRSDIPAALNDIYLKMMAKSPDDRFRTMAEVVQVLTHCSQELGLVPSDKHGSPAHGGSTGTSSSTVVHGQGPQTITSRDDVDGKLKILMVEPSRVQASIIRTYLDPHLTTVTGTVATGADAIASILADRPGAILSAMYLSDMTGIELATKVRQELPKQAPGFVLISSSETESEQAGTLSQLNRVVLLHKPFTAANLAGALQLVTGRSVSMVDMPSAFGKKERSKLRVLVVDDSTTARTYERMILNSLGFTQIAEANDGAQAIAAATREQFDLIVTDYNMPLLDGRALISYLKQTDSTAKVPIIMVTTESDDRILNPVRELGVAAIFPKTFPKEEVAKVVDDLFN